MNSCDPIADLLTRIRNAQKANKKIATVPASKEKIAIAHLLKQEGFVGAYKCFRDNKQGLLKIAIKYVGKTGVQGAITGIQRWSKPGRRYYVQSKNIPYVKNGYGVAILSTSQGIMTCRQARKKNTGGEILCSVY